MFVGHNEQKGDGKTGNFQGTEGFSKVLLNRTDKQYVKLFLIIKTESTKSLAGSPLLTHTYTEKSIILSFA